MLAAPAVRGRGTLQRGLTALLLLLSVSAWSSQDARAQDSCVAGNLGRNDVLSSTVPGLGRITYVSGAHFVCDGGGQIWADSAVVYDSRSMSEFIGSFRYVDGDRELLADDARYFFDLGRLQAEGNVSLRDEEAGSSIRNGDLVLMLANEMRDEESMSVTTGDDGVRPIAVLTPPADTSTTVPDSLESPNALASPDSLDIEGVERVAVADTEATDVAEPETPYTITGDRIDLQGGSTFTSVGNVEIVRDSLIAFADSVEYDQLLGGLVLSGAARVVGDGYDLAGRTITMESPGSAGRTLRSRREAVLTGDDLLLTAAQIIVFMKDDGLERLVAIPIIRRGASSPDEPADSVDLELPRATVDDFLLTADSLEVWAPDETIERVFAAGQARSTSTSRDTLNVSSLPDIARTDWLEGDTVIVTFRTPGAVAGAAATVPASDDVPGTTASTAMVTAPGMTTGTQDRPPREVDAIVARGRARSLYRLEASDTMAQVGVDPPAVHYVVGDEIRIEMNQGEVRGMQVKGQTRGVHLEPLRRPPPATTTPPDTLGTAPAGDGTSPVGRNAPNHTPAVPGMRNAPATPTTPDTPTVSDEVTDPPREERPWIPR